MIPAGGIAVVVLAAGKSSRMGTAKPLLPFGSVTAIERLIGSVARSRVGDIIVVTGHDLDKMIPILDGLPVRRIHNARYESGMFSSVFAGVAALQDDVEAFLVLPADYPLIRPEVLDRLIDAFRQDGRPILHPACCRVRGHPPLISGGLRDSLLRADDVTSLRDFFRQHSEDEVEVEMEDLTILMDMDTEEDYRRLGRFAGLLDTPVGGTVDMATGLAMQTSGTPDQVPSSEDAFYLLSLLEVPDTVVRHCRAVAEVGEALALALQPHVSGLDVDLVRAAGLLHDMAKGMPKHAVVGQNILKNLGLSRLGSVVGAHMFLPAEQAEAPLPTEEQLVYLADKLVIEDEVAGVEARAARALSRQGRDAAAIEGVKKRMGTAEMIRDKVETILKRPLEEVLPRETRSST